MEQPAAPAQRMRILVVTGVSGAGKSTALRALEDVGYYCVDNLPLPLLQQFVELLGQSNLGQPNLGHGTGPAGPAGLGPSSGQTGDSARGPRKAALVIDAREGEFLGGFRAAMAKLRSAGHDLEVLFLDAADDVLLRRFSETRRRHPLHGPVPTDDLRAAIANERRELSSLREEAHAIVDTGDLNVHQLKGVIQERYGRTDQPLAVTLVSFGFKHGLPAEADLILDVRFLPNPYFVAELSPHTGLSEPVARYVLSHPDAEAFLERAAALLDFYLPRAQREGKAYLTVAIGCTGGRHRSVAMVSELFNRLGSRYQITVRHRELGRGRES